MSQLSVIRSVDSKPLEEPRRLDFFKRTKKPQVKPRLSPKGAVKKKKYAPEFLADRLISHDGPENSSFERTFLLCGSRLKANLENSRAGCCPSWTERFGCVRVKLQSPFID